MLFSQLYGLSNLKMAFDGLRAKKGESTQIKKILYIKVKAQI